MAFRVNGSAPLVAVQVSAGLSAAGASAITTQNLVVSGITGDMCIANFFHSAHSSGLYLMQPVILSANNVQIALFNATNGSITHGATQLRFVSL